MLEGPLPGWAKHVPDLQIQGTNISSEDQSAASGLSGGAIAGIVIGTIIAVILIVVGIILIWKRYKKDSFERYRADHIEPSNIM